MTETAVCSDWPIPPERAARPQGLSDPTINLRRISAMVFRVPIDKPVITSFGIMRDRPAVLVRVEDAQGAVGWGEVWANFPSCGAEHRARLVTSVLGPQLIGRTHVSPTDAFLTLEKAVRVLALQSAEWGPLAQVLAGMDIALWDLVTRREGVPLYKALGGTRDAVPAYASGINPDGALDTIERCRAGGYRAFKVKVGFDAERDVAVVREAAAGLKPGEQLMLDANQAWDPDTAASMVEQLSASNPVWLEEPISADRPLDAWYSLRDQSAIPIAGGENLRGIQAFETAIDNRAFAVVQPDVCKWGGITGCAAVGRMALEGGLRYCPHFLGAGIGLTASAHLLAAVGGDGLLEVDSNVNPLRDVLATPPASFQDGVMTLVPGPGLGVEPELDRARQWQVFSDEARA